MTRSEQLGQRVAGQLVEGGSRAGPKAGPTYLHCCAGPSIGRAGRPHRPPCSPQWHLSREGAVSQDPPRSPQPAPRCRLPAQGRTGSLALPRLPDTDSGHTASLFPSSLSSFHRSRLQPQLRAKEATEAGGKGEGAGFLSRRTEASGAGGLGFPRQGRESRAGRGCGRSEPKVGQQRQTATCVLSRCVFANTETA